MNMQTKHKVQEIVVVIIISLLLLWMASRDAGAQTGDVVEPAAVSEEAMATVVSADEPALRVSGAPDACAASPFGNLLLMGAEREIFVSYKGGAAPYQNWLAATRLDLTDEGKLQPQQTWLSGALAASLTNVTEPVATLADLDANGKVELLQALRNSDGQLLLVEQSNALGLTTWQSTASNHQGIAIASGNLTRSALDDEEIALVSRSPVNSLSVQLINGTNHGGLPSDGLTLGLWRSVENFRNAPTLLNVATGDLDGDGADDEVIVAFQEDGGNFLQLIVLEYTPGHLYVDNHSPSNYQNNLKEIATLRVEAGNARNLQVTAADSNGDFRDEIVLAYDHGNDDNDGYSNKITVRTYSMTVYPQGALITQHGQWENPGVRNPNLALAAADSDGDGVAEVILAYEDAPDGLTIVSLDAEVATIVAHNWWQNKENYRDQVRDLALDAADLDRDGLAEIVAGFRDQGNWLQTVRVNDSITATVATTVGLPFGMSLVDAWRNGDEGRMGATNISVRLGDWDNDSLKAQYAPAMGGMLQCKQTIEPQITSAIFVPPFWQQIQGGQYIYGSVGKTESQEKSTETALSSFYSHSASGYFGGGVGAEGTVFSFETSVKLTAGYEYAATQTRAGSQNQGQSIAVGWTNFSDFMVVDDVTYDCYSYQLMQGGVAVEGSARFCENKGLKNRSLSLDAWDMRDDIDLQWTPVVRDWSNLALFRDFYASQSSIDPSIANNSAALAADGNTDGVLANGSVMQTQAETAPWWQIDLGSVQDITKIRLWNRNNVGCTLPSCMNQLTDVHLFITDSDPGTISNDPNVLKTAPGVVSYFHEGVGSRVTTFRTLDANFQPTRGRYVRVQLAGLGVLSLAEVQIFGTNHVDPHRYPVGVWDPDGKTNRAGNYVPGTDGWFNVQLHNPVTGQLETVRTRGNLLWNGANQGVLNNQQIGDGESTLTWSLGTTTGGASSVITATSHTAKIGAEFDVEAGIIPVKIQTGGSYEYGTGFGREHTQTIAWEKGFELDGGVQGFPRVVEGQVVQWPAQCRYGFQPYYYELGDESDIGYAHKFLVLDYIVPVHLMNRTANLEPCRQGSYKTGNNRAPQVNNTIVIDIVGSSMLIDILATVEDPDHDVLSLLAVGNASNGVVTIVENRILYTPNLGYVGEDSFTYTVSDGFGGEVTALLKVVVGGTAAQQTLYLPIITR